MSRFDWKEGSPIGRGYFWCRHADGMTNLWRPEDMGLVRSLKGSIRVTHHARVATPEQVEAVREGAYQCGCDIGRMEP